MEFRITKALASIYAEVELPKQHYRPASVITFFRFLVPRWKLCNNFGYNSINVYIPNRQLMWIACYLQGIVFILRSSPPCTRDNIIYMHGVLKFKQMHNGFCDRMKMPKALERNSGLEFSSLRTNSFLYCIRLKMKITIYE